MTTKLEAYNEALRHLKTRRIRTLSDVRTERRELDSAWEGCIDYMLEKGKWNFCSATVQWDPATDVETQFGYAYAYEQPSDFIRLAAICDNESMRPTLEDYEVEGGYIFAHATPLFVTYISSDSTHGRDPGKWTPAFTRALTMELAYRCPKISNLSTQDFEALRRERKRMLAEARGSDAVNQPLSRLPMGRLVSSRVGWSGQTNRMRRTPYA